MGANVPRVRVEAEIRPTEDPEKVKQAVLNVFIPDRIRIEEYGEYRLLVAEADSLRSLERLHQLLRQDRILDAARRHMTRGVEKGFLVFKLNKQVALVGHVSFVDMDSEAPMGPITFIVEWDKPEEVVDWLAPPTRMGRPIYEKPRPDAS
ncbi:protein of unknown function DUF54 [Pyrolobus fumarii 1A]|uniref:UPF0201 protein Pyrfu_0044 n=1 Tax=Pyrolobus fumarii (strain DSM 11204 / 1A) TaxID=694429 RepID=G0EE00_PYRF1|nr:protein of unknown function DUF54 [Pyrolobus fumarii 1A]